MSRCRVTQAALLTLGSILALGPATLAQPAAQPGGSAPPAGAPPMEVTQPAARYPIFAITGAEILRSKAKPEISVVVVRGITSAEGWDNGELVPLGHGAPPDGVLDLVFVADAPLKSGAPTGYTPMHAVLPLPEGHPYKAIRVRGATNSLLLKDLQSQVEAKPPAEACKQCVGRHFVAKGAAAPAGAEPDRTVREEDLPPNTRIIRATDGIADLQRDPNRLTIVVGEDGRVVDAAWE